ncbi:MAG: hypothetical protein EXR62_17040 [Chloroflexi bacterium]|nr:hypothetical protein [Chloroflexota bacterium]
MTIDQATTSTDWRDDEKNLFIVAELNRAYDQVPFSHEYEGVLDDCPVTLTWEIGPNLPVAWKGGVAGIMGDDIALTGGLWMPSRANRAYAYHIAQQSYTEMPPPPFETAYTQGICDGENLYIVSGRAAGQQVARLGRASNGLGPWNALPALPDAGYRGWWLGLVAIIPGKWLFILTGHPTGTPSETAGQDRMPDYRLRLDRPGAQWEPMAPYPGGKRNLVCGGATGGKLYVFGGSRSNGVMRAIHQTLAQKFMVSAPYNGVPHYRDAFCYDPAADHWHPIRSLPFPMAGGAGLVLRDRYILLMGSSETKSLRVGKSRSSSDPHWRGYGDLILCYDVLQDNYARVGVMPYGVATCPWVCDGRRVYGFGGEPAHGFNENTENVLQIGTLTFKDGDQTYTS